MQDAAPVYSAACTVSGSAVVLAVFFFLVLMYVWCCGVVVGANCVGLGFLFSALALPSLAYCVFRSLLVTWLVRFKIITVLIVACCNA